MINTSVSLGSLCAVEVGSAMSFWFGNCGALEEFTNKKKTKMVKISISDTIFKDEALRILWLRSMRRKRREPFFTALPPLPDREDRPTYQHLHPHCSGPGHHR